ncbi:MAG: hypothetical protein JF616_20875 [Fibrobacteres bacterium]|jgi:hypothetical protein|nr:hypothetical protein [Fibrobacterota bacterium]
MFDLTFRPNTPIPKRDDFIWWTNHVKDAYLRALGDVKTGKIKKINLGGMANDYVREKPYHYSEKVDPGITGGAWPFDFEAWWQADTLQRKRMVIDWLRDRLLEIGKFHGWDLEPFQRAHDEVVKNGFVNQCTDSKGVASPDKKWIAKRHYDFNQDRIAYFIVVEGKDKAERGRFPVAESQPNVFHLRKTMGKLQWTSPTRVALLGEDGSEKGAVELKDKLKE